MKSRLKSNDIKIHLMHNESKSGVRARFIRVLKIYFRMYARDIKKCLYRKTTKLADENNNITHRVSKLKPADLKRNTHINLDVQINTKN